MSLPTSITLNVGSPAADVVYGEQSHINGSAVIYYAPSPAGDLMGRPQLRFGHETTRNGIARSVVSFNTPVYDSDGAFAGYIKTDVVHNRPLTVSVAASEAELEKVSEVLTSTVRAAIASASL